MNTPMQALNHGDFAEGPSQAEQDHSTIMRIFISTLGICSHMMLKGQGGMPGQTHKGFEQSSCEKKLCQLAMFVWAEPPCYLIRTAACAMACRAPAQNQ